MSRFSALVFLLIVYITAARHFIIPFHSLLSSSPSATSSEQAPACEGDACAIGSQPSNHSVPADLENKVVEQWKTATVSSSTGEENDDPSATSATTSSASVDPKVQELVKLGWKESQALLALNYTSYNVEEAIELLEKEEDEMQILQANIKLLNTQYGWKVEAAESALVQTNQNITASLELLENEEKIIHDNFEVAVKDMLANGWHEFVARQALLTQWTIDQKTVAGINVTISDESLKNIRPTLKQQNETATSDAASATGTASNKKGTNASKKGVGKDDVPKPKPAKREDCVFDVTSENFQKVVVESTVPVILDVYADWCGPCKQLGPMLEEAAINSGGMFRLCKVNSDTQNSIAQTFNVNSLPTVFAVNNGKMTDRFIGMLPTEQLQQFLVRAVTGYGNRVQNELSDKNFQELTFKMTTMAGMASLTFRKKEKLYSLIQNAMSTYSMDSSTSDTTDTDGAVPLVVSSSESLQTALLYISNAAKDIMNPKFRRISTESKAYKEKIAGNQCASQLLDIAGYRLNTTAAAVTVTGTTTTGGGSAVLELNHKNAALLQMIVQKVNENLGKMKFAQKKKTSVGTSSGRSTGSGSSLPQGEVIFSPPKNKSLKRAAAAPSQPSTAATSSIATAVAKSSAKTATTPSSVKKAEVKQPPSPASATTSSNSDSSGSTSRKVDKEKIKALLKAQAAKKSSHSLSSTGIINNDIRKTATNMDSKIKKGSGGGSSKELSKQQEYFGGDSTVFLSREDDEDDGEDEEEEVEEEEDNTETIVATASEEIETKDGNYNNDDDDEASETEDSNDEQDEGEEEEEEL